MNAPHATTVGTLRRVLFVLLAAVFAVASSASGATASATGASGFGPKVTYKGFTGYAGTYWVNINGSGNYVSYVKAWPQLNTPVGSVCNWNVTAEFFDSNGRWYKTYTGPLHKTCNSYWNQANADIIYIRSTMKTGKMCSTLKSSGSRLTSVCHSIHP